MSRDDSLLRVADWHPLYCLLERGQGVSVHHSSWARLNANRRLDRSGSLSLSVCLHAVAAGRRLALPFNASTSARVQPLGQRGAE